MKWVNRTHSPPPPRPTPPPPPPQGDVCATGNCEKRSPDQSSFNYRGSRCTEVAKQTSREKIPSRKEENVAGGSEKGPRSDKNQLPKKQKLKKKKKKARPLGTSELEREAALPQPQPVVCGAWVLVGAGENGAGVRRRFAGVTCKAMACQGGRPALLCAGMSESFALPVLRESWRAFLTATGAVGQLSVAQLALLGRQCYNVAGDWGWGELKDVSSGRQSRCTESQTSNSLLAGETSPFLSPRPLHVPERAATWTEVSGYNPDLRSPELSMLG